jgi:hypothetical protein
MPYEAEVTSLNPSSPCVGMLKKKKKKKKKKRRKKYKKKRTILKSKRSVICSFKKPFPSFLFPLFMCPFHSSLPHTFVSDIPNQKESLETEPYPEIENPNPKRWGIRSCSSSSFSVFLVTKVFTESRSSPSRSSRSARRIPTPIISTAPRRSY